MRALFVALVALAALGCVSADIIGNGTFYPLLVVRTDEDRADIQLVYDQLKRYNLPYEELTIPKTGLSDLTPYISGKYSGIIHASISNQYQDGSLDGLWKEPITPDQWWQLQAIQVVQKIRRVNFAVFPSTEKGSTPEDPVSPGTKDEIFISFTQAGKEMSSHVNVNLNVSTEGLLWLWPAKMVATNGFEAIPVLSGQHNGANATLGVIVVRDPSGPQRREILDLYFNQAIWAKASVALVDWWLPWVTNGRAVPPTPP
eukprot:Colp12_sorted_trinity150504_noHs@8220